MFFVTVPIGIVLNLLVLSSLAQKAFEFATLFGRQGVHAQFPF
jgi:hypothetical protein